MKNTYLISIKLFLLHIVFAGGLLGAYNLLIKQILGVEKLFDILLITTFFNVIAVIGTFALAVKILKKHNADLFHGKHRAILLFYALIIFFASAVILLFAILFKGMLFNNALSILACVSVFLFFYYYFLRLTYYILILNKLRKTAIIFAVILITGYLLILLLPQSNYKKAYNQIEVKEGFTYFHNLDLEEIVGRRDLKDKNSAEEFLKLVSVLISEDEKITDGGEVLSYILPTKSELELLSGIAGNKYLSFSEEYLSKEIRRTGTTMIVPLNDLRSFSRGLVKLAEQKRAEGLEDEAINMINNLLLVGNQMLDVKSDTLITKLVGGSIMHDGLDELLKIYKNDDFKIKIITHLDNELDNMRNGNRLLRSAVSRMNNAIVGSPESTALFFKHFDAQKHNIGGEFDGMLASNNHSLINGYVAGNTTDLKKFVLSIMVLPVMLPFELNVGNNYIIYRETIKLTQEPGHEMLDYYFKTSFADFMKNRDGSQKKAMLITDEIFGNKKMDL